MSARGDDPQVRGDARPLTGVRDFRGEGCGRDLVIGRGGDEYGWRGRDDGECADGLAGRPRDDEGEEIRAAALALNGVGGTGVTFITVRGEIQHEVAARRAADHADAARINVPLPRMI